MRVALVGVPLAILVASASPSFAQYLVNELSFGVTGRVSTDSGLIEHFNVNGQPSSPQIYSNKVVLTPIAPGNQRGSVWAQQPLTVPEWTVDVEFRATGPERGSGNLNIWLVNNGESQVGSSSIYTVGRFDGLSLVIDAHGGSGGMVRGFLNDGAVDYSSHHNIDELAFGHCLYSYRNLGRPSQVKLRQTRTSFRVEMDGAACFESDKFSVPAGYSLGISAATPDTPDSFEVFKMSVLSDTSMVVTDGDQQQQHQRMMSNQAPGSSGSFNQLSDDDIFQDSPDQSADIFSTSKAQFEDLHNRLQASSHQVSATYRVIKAHEASQMKRNEEFRELLQEVKNQMAKLDHAGELERRLGVMEGELRSIRTELNKRFQSSQQSLENFLKDHHATLSQKMVDSVPGHGRIMILFLGTQLLLVVAFIAYKRRKHLNPKKYL